MYTSPLTKNMKDLKFPQIRLGLQGAPGTGKSYCHKTFPNVNVLDRDNSLTAFAGTDTLVLPFWDDNFVASLNGGKWAKPYKVGLRLNRRDAFKWFMETEAPKYEEGQTLFIDSWTAIQSDFDHQTWAEPHFTKKGEVDDFKPWAQKIDYSDDLLVGIQSLRCHVVITFHEIQVRDKNTGQLLDKVAPLMQGQFVAQIKKHFTDFFRTKHIPGKGDNGYVWQVKSDNQFDAKTRLTKLPANEIYAQPSFSIFKEFGYDPSQTNGGSEASTS